MILDGLLKLVVTSVELIDNVLEDDFSRWQVEDVEGNSVVPCRVTVE